MRAERHTGIRLVRWGARLCALLLATDLRALPPTKDDWIQIRTANFTFFSNAGERRTVDIARRLERFRAVLSKIHNKAEINAPVETLVYVFKDDASFTPYKMRFRGRPVALGGYFRSSPDVNYIVLNGDSRTDPLHTVYHEYTHYFVASNLPRVPLWFDEGLAECYSTFVADDKEAQIGKPVMDHIAFLRSQPLMALPDLFAIGHNSKDYNEGDRRGVFYAESWALVHYLLWDKPERRPQLLQFVELLVQGAPVAEAFPRSFLTTYEKLQYELANQIRQERFIFRVGKVDDIRADTDTLVSPMKREEVLYRLGELLVYDDATMRAEAEEHFEAGLRANPEGAFPQAGIGHLRDLERAYDEAAQRYERALALAPDDYLITYRLGASMMRRFESSPETVRPGVAGLPPDLARARALFEKSIHLRPGFAEAYVGLGSTYALEPAAAGSAIPFLETARRLLPSRTDIVLNLISLHVRQGDREAARALIQDVLAHVNDEVARAAARRSLALLEAQEAAAREVAPAREVAAQEAGATGTPGGETPIPDEGRTPENAPADDLPSLAPLPPPARKKGTDVDTLNRQIGVYNHAVELANGGDDKGAIALLEKLLDEVNDFKLAAQTRDFLIQVRWHLAREARKKTSAR